MIRTGVQIKAGVFPPLWRWEADLEELRDAGISLIACPVPWCLVERAPGKFDFSLFEDYLRTAAERELRVILAPLPEPPVWIQERCFDLPEYRTALLAFFHALAERFGREAWLDAWRLETLSLAECRCPESIALYQKYLSSVFDSVAELNTRWHRNYFSFDQIPPETPECLPDSPETMCGSLPSGFA